MRWTALGALLLLPCLDTSAAPAPVVPRFEVRPFQPPDGGQSVTPPGLYPIPGSLNAVLTADALDGTRTRLVALDGPDAGQIVQELTPGARGALVLRVHQGQGSENWFLAGAANATGFDVPTSWYRLDPGSLTLLSPGQPYGFWGRSRRDELLLVEARDPTLWFIDTVHRLSGGPITTTASVRVPPPADAFPLGSANAGVPGPFAGGKFYTVADAGSSPALMALDLATPDGGFAIVTRLDAVPLGGAFYDGPLAHYALLIDRSGQTISIHDLDVAGAPLVGTMTVATDAGVCAGRVDCLIENLVVSNEAFGSFDAGVVLVPMRFDGRQFTAVIDWSSVASALTLRSDGTALPAARLFEDVGGSGGGGGGGGSPNPPLGPGLSGGTGSGCSASTHDSGVALSLLALLVALGLSAARRGL
ncbi:MAG: hypothetical protein ACXWLL_03590 [Myxococcaceae bacterium]